MTLEEAPGRLGKWLERYPNQITKGAQVGYLRIFFTSLGETVIDLRGMNRVNKEKVKQHRIDRIIQLNNYIEQYINEDRNFAGFTEDLINMIKWMNTREKPYSYKSVGAVYGGVKRFFSRQPENKIDNRYTLSEVDDEDIQKTLIPSRGEVMRDEKPTKAQLRSILEYLSIQYKAFALFACSTGTRPGAIRRIQLEDMDLDANPPTTYLRQKEGGKSVAPQVWFSYEARDAIKAWLKVLPTIRKKTGGNYDINTPLKLSYSDGWNSALKKAGLDQLYEMPRATRYIYHFYTLRKFFYTQMKNNGMNVGIVDALMGHEGYLTEAYDRTGVEKLAELYLQHMDAVQIYVKEDEFISDQTYISANDVDEYKTLGWKWSGDTLPDGRLSMDWNRSGKPKYPVVGE